MFIRKNDRQRVGSFFLLQKIVLLCDVEEGTTELRTHHSKSPFNITKEKIVETCSRFGPIASVRSLKGFCFVRFHFKADAARCLKQLNAKPFGENKKKKKKKEEDDEGGVTSGCSRLGIEQRSVYETEQQLEEEEDEDDGLGRRGTEIRNFWFRGQEDERRKIDPGITTTCCTRSNTVCV